MNMNLSVYKYIQIQILLTQCLYIYLLLTHSYSTSASHVVQAITSNNSPILYQIILADFFSWVPPSFVQW